MATIIYKICGRTAWGKALETGSYRGSGDDLRDGFIHLSTAQQLQGTADKHFAGREDLLVVAFAAGTLGDALAWETSRCGQLFPHYYGTLDPAEALWARPLVLCDGAFRFDALRLEGEA